MDNKVNPGGSLGDYLFKIPEFVSKESLVDYLKNFKGYDYSNSFLMINYIKEKYVAEMGCGHGYISICLSSVVKKLEGFDVDPAGIEEANLLKDRYSLTNIDFFVFDGYNTARQEGLYDVVISTDVLEHVPEPLKYLKECYRILKEGGLLILTTPNGLISKKNDCIIKSHSPFHVTEYYPSDLEKMLSDTKFDIIETFRKINSITRGYRISKFFKFVYISLCHLHLFNTFSRIKRNIRQQKVQLDPFSNYSVYKCPLNFITDLNCDVIVIISSK